MKQTTYFKTLALALCCLFSLSTYGQTEQAKYAPGQVLVKMKTNRTTTQKNALKNQMNASLLRSKPNSNIEVWEIDQSKGEIDIQQIISQYHKHPDIEYIEPNYYYYLTMEDCLEEPTHHTKVISPEITSPLERGKEGCVDYAKPPNFPADTPLHSPLKRGRISLCETPSWGQTALNTTPNDALYPHQWNLHNTGQADLLTGNAGTPDADIDAPEAWDIATGSSSIVVGLIDTGIDWKHPDLINNIWQNLGEDADGDGQVLEQNINGVWIFDPGDIDTIDNDGNGYLNDFIGWDFINNDNDPFDLPGSSSSGHGTHVAGTIGAEGNNGIGVAGVTWDVQIAALRVFAQQTTTIDVIAEALDYAVMMDMPISNNSYAEGEYSNRMIEALDSAEVNGHLFVAAAGNFRNNNDTNPNYPSSYNFDNIISVAATNRNDQLWVQSNLRGSSYGATNVDIAAPGRRIKSTYPQNNYRYNTGTSMATPHVTGACALLWEQYPDKTYGEIKTAVLGSVDVLPDLSGKCVSEGRLNLYGALTYFEEDTVSLSCRERDSLALVALYEATDGGNSWYGSGTSVWDLTQPMNTWSGVTLDGNGCVSSLILFNRGLNGSIPPEIGNLNNLTGLVLAYNQLSGSIPPEIGNLNNLASLSLSNNQLSGSIPPELGNLNYLESLNLSNNQLSGCYNINLNFASGSNSTISDGNNFDASWQDFISNGVGACNPYISCRQSDSLALVDLYDSTNGTGWTNTWDLDQPIDTWYGVTLNQTGCLTHLHLPSNQLNGNIPIEIGNLNDLISLGLYTNQLSGSIPPEIGNLNNLTHLYLNSNQLNGNIPNEIGNLNNLEVLFLSFNQLSGNIPSQIGDLNNLTTLHLYSNTLSGNIPSELGNLNNLRILYLHNNYQLSGSIPPEIGNLSNMLYLQLFNNNLNGCYDNNLLSLCSQIASNSNYYISNGNNFNAPWEDFCNTGAGTCTPVWPSDYNYDGTANETDALYWGLAFGNEGDARPNATTIWEGQQAPEWLTAVEGINGKHQDGNGDGIVNGADLQVLDDNFGNIHAYTQSVYIASSMVYRLEEAELVAGDPSYDLYVTDTNGDSIAAHGLAINIDFGDIPIDSVELRLDSSSLLPSHSLQVMDTINNRLHLALTRTDGDNPFLIGPVANFIVVTRDIPTGDSLKMDIENGTVIQANGDMATIAGMSFYPYDPAGLSNNSLVVSASVIHEQCTMPGSISLSVEGGEPPYSYRWNTGATSSSLSNLTPNIYAVTVTGLDDSTKVLSVEVQGEYISIPDEFGIFPDCINSPCPTLLTPSGTVGAGTYKAGTAVNSDGTVDGAVEFKAGETIILRPGFEVPPGTDFSGEIENCPY